MDGEEREWKNIGDNFLGKVKESNELARKCWEKIKSESHGKEKIIELEGEQARDIFTEKRIIWKKIYGSL